MRIKPPFVLWNYRNVKGWRYFRVLGRCAGFSSGLSMFSRFGGGCNMTFGIKATKPEGTAQAAMRPLRWR